MCMQREGSCPYVYAEGGVLSLCVHRGRGPVPMCTQREGSCPYVYAEGGVLSLLTCSVFYLFSLSVMRYHCAK